MDVFVAGFPVGVDGNGAGLIAQSHHAFVLIDGHLPLSTCQGFAFWISDLHVKKWPLALAP